VCAAPPHSARLRQGGRAAGAQDRFEERWAAAVAPKLAEAEQAARIDEEAAVRRLAEAAQRAAAEAAAAEAAALAAHFEGVEARLQDAKALAAQCCEPAPAPAETVRPPGRACAHAQQLLKRRFGLAGNGAPTSAAAHAPRAREVHAGGSVGARAARRVPPPRPTDRAARRTRRRPRAPRRDPTLAPGVTLRAAARAQDALAAALGALPGEHLEWAMQILLARHPELAPAPDGSGELALELDKLGTVTLRHLQAFAAACAQPGGPGAVWPGLPVGAGVPPARRPAPPLPSGCKLGRWTLGSVRASLCRLERRRQGGTLRSPPQQKRKPCLQLEPCWAAPPPRSRGAPRPARLGCSAASGTRTGRAARAGIRAPRGLAKRARMGAAAAGAAAAGAPLALGAAPAAATPDAAGAAMPARGSAPLPLRPPSRLGLAGTPDGPVGLGGELRSQSLPAALHAAARPPAPALAGARARRVATGQHSGAAR
jgi:hypothetical protein